MTICATTTLVFTNIVKLNKKDWK